MGTIKFMATKPPTSHEKHGIEGIPTKTWQPNHQPEMVLIDSQKSYGELESLKSPDEAVERTSGVRCRVSCADDVEVTAGDIWVRPARNSERSTAGLS